MNFDQHSIFLITGISIIAGVVWGTLQNSGLMFAFMLIVMSVVIWRTINNVVLNKLLLLILLGLGIGIARASLISDYSSELNNFLNRKITVNGTIVNVPEEKNEQTTLVVRPNDHRSLIIVRNNRYPKLEQGMQVELIGKLKVPNDKIEDFEYRKYLMRNGIYYEMYFPETRVISPATIVDSCLNTIRNRINSGVGKILPEPESSLLLGIVLGIRGGIDKNLKENFSKAGTSHVLVLSGFNITIVANILLTLLVFLPRMIRGLLGSVTMILFGMLAGGGAVVWRSVSMALIAWYAGLSGRIYDVTASILATVLAISLWNPQILIADLGFQLAVVALMGIVYLGPIVFEYLPKNLPKQFRETIASSFAAQAAVLPLLSIGLGKISLVGFISNLIVIPIVLPIMLVGLIIAGLVVVNSSLAWPAAIIAKILISVLITVVNFFASLPASEIHFSMGYLTVLIIYFFLIYWAILYWRRTALLSKTKSP